MGVRRGLQRCRQRPSRGISSPSPSSRGSLSSLAATHVELHAHNCTTAADILPTSNAPLGLGRECLACDRHVKSKHVLARHAWRERARLVARRTITLARGEWEGHTAHTQPARLSTAQQNKLAACSRKLAVARPLVLTVLLSGLSLSWARQAGRQAG